MYIVMIFCLSECSRATTERSCTSLTCIRTICLHLQSVLLPWRSEAVWAATRTEENRLHLLPLLLPLRGLPRLQQQHWDRSCLPVRRDCESWEWANYLSGWTRVAQLRDKFSLAAPHRWDGRNKLPKMRIDRKKKNLKIIKIKTLGLVTLNSHINVKLKNIRTTVGLVI